MQIIFAEHNKSLYSCIIQTSWIFNRKLPIDIFEFLNCRNVIERIEILELFRSYCFLSFGFSWNIIRFNSIFIFYFK